MRRFLLGVLVGILLWWCLAWLAERPAEMPWLDPDERKVLVKTEYLIDETRVRELEYKWRQAESVADDLRRRIETKVRVISRLRGELDKVRVPVDLPPPGPVTLLEPEPLTIPEFESVPCAPPAEVEIFGGCETQIVKVENGRAATIDWWASVRDPEIGWTATRGPERAETVLFETVESESVLPRSTSWALGVGLWAPRSGLLDSSFVASLRRSAFGEGRKWGWWAMLETSVNAGSVHSGTFAYDQPALPLGGVGVQLGLERRFAK